MALPGPDPGRKIMTCHVTGIPHFQNAYLACQNRLEPGQGLTLQADFDNPHDANAIKIIRLGKQLGWVPKAFNRHPAQLLRASVRLHAAVISHHPGSQMLEIEICAYGENKSRDKPLATIPWHSLGSAGMDGMGALRDLPHGTVLRCRTSDTRTSISICPMPVGAVQDFAWIRKEGLSAEVLKYAQHHELVAVLYRQALVDPQLCLYKKGTEPDIRGPVHPLSDEAEAASRTVFGARVTSATYTPQTPKENTMNFSNTLTTTINFNKTAAGAAAYLEAGRIANNKVAQLAGKTLPMMVRGYADTAGGRLVIANIAAMAAAQLRPQDATLQKLTMAMTTAAYQEVIQKIDIEGMLDSLLSAPEIQRAISKLPKDDTDHLMSTQANRDHLEKSMAQARGMANKDAGAGSFGPTPD